MLNVNNLMANNKIKDEMKKWSLLQNTFINLSNFPLKSFPLH